MEAGNSWVAGQDAPDANASLLKRLRLKMWRAIPLDPLL